VRHTRSAVRRWTGWVCIDDEDISDFDFPKAIDPSGVYMLFYEKDKA
jgi:ubiquitin C-terminal hydrolase